ncbi:MAG: DUF357 domain-containing protein [Methanobacteriaceae archaeon]|nr:DUF357 domain-containing protein [Methanobacteriaceae archaeon]
MNYEERIKKDIELFKRNLNGIEGIELSNREKDIIERAMNYNTDTIYYLEKKDYITSFGCITYAHGLLDAIRIMHDLI